MAKPAAPLREEPASGMPGAAALTYPLAQGPLFCSSVSAALGLMPVVMSSSASWEGLQKLLCRKSERHMWKHVPALCAGGHRGQALGLLPSETGRNFC